MLDLKDLIIFGLVAVAQSGSPGPSVVLVITNSITYGACRAIAMIVWDIAGIALLACVSALASNLIIEYQQLLIPVQILGGLYLLVLAYTKLKVYFVTRENGFEVDVTRIGNVQGYQSFLVAVLNPKALVFFSTIFPVFISNYGSSNYEATVNACILITMYLFIRYILLTGYSVLAERMFDPNMKSISTINVIGAAIFLSFSMYLFSDVYATVFVNKTIW